MTPIRTIPYCGGAGRATECVALGTLETETKSYANIHTEHSRKRRQQVTVVACS